MGRAATDTKEKLIDTALCLIWKQSYGSVSVDDICKAADVKKGSFYHFFSSKSDLAVEAMESFYKETKPRFDEIFSPATPPLVRLENMAKGVLEAQESALKQHGRVCGCPMSSMGSEMAGQDEAIRAKAGEIIRRHEKYYASAVRDLIADGTLPASTDATVMASELYNYMLGKVLIARIHNTLEPLKTDLFKGFLRILGLNPARKEKDRVTV